MYLKPSIYAACKKDITQMTAFSGLKTDVKQLRFKDNDSWSEVILL